MSNCYVCDKPIEGEPCEVLNHRTGNVWHHHAECNPGAVPVPDSYAATARFMASLDPDDDFDWDRWKDEMKEGDL